MEIDVVLFTVTPRGQLSDTTNGRRTDAGPDDTLIVLVLVDVSESAEDGMMRGAAS
jgi:hypothetical protein